MTKNITFQLMTTTFDVWLLFWKFETIVTRYRYLLEHRLDYPRRPHAVSGEFRILCYFPSSIPVDPWTNILLIYSAGQSAAYARRVRKTTTMYDVCGHLLQWHYIKVTYNDIVAVEASKPVYVAIIELYTACTKRMMDLVNRGFWKRKIYLWKN